MHSKVTEKVSPDKEPSPWDSAIVRDIVNRTIVERHSVLCIPLPCGDEVQRVMARVILADPADAERVARIHVRKEPNFGGAMLFRWSRASLGPFPRDSFCCRQS